MSHSKLYPRTSFWLALAGGLGLTAVSGQSLAQASAQAPPPSPAAKPAANPQYGTYAEPPPQAPPPQGYQYAPVPYGAEQPPPPPMRVRVVPKDTNQLTGQYGYMWGASVETPSGTVDLDGAPSYTLVLNHRIPRNYGMVELSYTWVSTELGFRPYGLGTQGQRFAGLDMHYFELGGQREFQPGRVRPFIGMTLGAVYLNPDTGYDDEWRLSTTFLGGIKFMASPKVGVRTQVRGLVTWEADGSSMFCGTGGCSFGLFGSGLVQAEASIGLFLAI